MISPFFLFWKQDEKSDSGGKSESFEPKVIKQQSLPIEEIKTKKTMATKTITVETIKELRDQTGISIMQCKKALEEAGGDSAKALVILRNKSGELAAKKSDRIFHSGTIQAYIHSNGMVGTIVELLCESDFVSNTNEFKALARDIAMHVTATNPRFLSKDDITEADKQTAMSVFEKEVAGKPEAVKAKILEGKMNSYFSEMVLMDQPFIKNPELTVQGLVNNAVQKFGEKMAVGKFKRFKVLEG
ncbi:MAG: elongation factor Ts [Candidatus Paceibacterota bacterium]